ncbi:MAG TPA: hypothetical protein VMH20_00140 [Verrucomicrobiae bacterium]|nr:hypothetical protein [Verrucomicrobiae bacterium]
MSGGLKQQLPFRMVADSQSRILITEPFLALVQVLDTKQGTWSQIRGERDHRLDFPTYIAVDGFDNIYLSEPFLSAVLVYQPDGRFLRSIGTDHLRTPFGLAIDQASRKLYVADHALNQVQVYSLEGQLLQTIANSGREPGELAAPCDLEFRDGNLVVLDSGNSRFQIFDLKGESVAVWPFGLDRLPYAFTFDPLGNMYYVDLESRGMLVTNAKDAALASLDIKIPYGQPGNPNGLLSFTTVSRAMDGSILALRPGFTVDVMQLQPQPQEQQAKLQ